MISNKKVWAELDSNQRRRSQWIYNPPPLTTRAPTHEDYLLSNNLIWG